VEVFIQYSESKPKIFCFVLGTVSFNCFNFRKEWVNVDAYKDAEAMILEGIIQKSPT